MLHFGSGRVSERKIKHPHKTPSALETHQWKSSEVIIPVLEHAKLHFDTGRDSVRIFMIKHPN